MGHILEPDRQLLIEDSEVPTAGAKVTRTWQVARTRAGGFVLRMGRRKGLPEPGKPPEVVFDEVDRREA